MMLDDHSTCHFWWWHISPNQIIHVALGEVTQNDQQHVYCFIPPIWVSLFHPCSNTFSRISTLKPLKPLNVNLTNPPKWIHEIHPSLVTPHPKKKMVYTKKMFVSSSTEVMLWGLHLTISPFIVDHVLESNLSICSFFCSSKTRPKNGILRLSGDLTYLKML